MKFWNWGPTTIWHNLGCVAFYFSKSLHPTVQYFLWGSRISLQLTATSSPDTKYTYLHMHMYIYIYILTIYTSEYTLATLDKQLRERTK